MLGEPSEENDWPWIETRQDRESGASRYRDRFVLTRGDCA